MNLMPMGVVEGWKSLANGRAVSLGGGCGLWGFSILWGFCVCASLFLVDSFKVRAEGIGIGINCLKEGSKVLLLGWLCLFAAAARHDRFVA